MAFNGEVVNLPQLSSFSTLRLPRFFGVGGIQHSSKGESKGAEENGCSAPIKKKTPTQAEKRLAEAAKRKGQKSILGMFARAPSKKKSKAS